MSKNKGQIDLAFLAIIIMLTLSFLVIMMGIHSLKFIIGLKSEVKISVDTLDRGSGLVALFQSGKNTSYSEIVGDLRAVNRKENIDADLSKILTKFKTYMAVYNETGGKIKEYGEIASELNKGKFDIALPGKRIGRVEIS